ncbi:uncharacterized protein LTR77_010679 [Saxophila tyrrhenica]|uniref:Cupin type-2 domain-containing protein n=1 Tax=Saxophila tyrrhenica TaxID=1690608 RepID=A0AAV9NVU3_9PEZI|nr:hypothetical protein LTR77_010679 [Saxophila tyrrhenica]
MASAIPIPNEDISFVGIKSGETFKLGPMTCRILEDGSHTSQRLGVAELTMPPHTPGPPPHWHEMHDETFLIQAGTVRFHVPDPESEGKDRVVRDAGVGDYVVVPIRAPHTFSNPGDEEATIIFTSTPSFYINYFKLLSSLSKPDEPLPGEVTMKAMSMFATIQVDGKPRLAK